IVAGFDTPEFVQAAQVDQMVENSEPQRQHRHQALPAGDDLGIVAEIRQQGHCLGRGGGGVVVEGRGFHAVTSVFPFARASSIMATIRAGERGSRSICTPNGASASATALSTAGVEPMAPPSPTPLNPPGPELGVSTWPSSITGTSAAVGSR